MGPTMPTEKFQFPGADGQMLAASLDVPDGAPPMAYALLAHCFTCGKDVLAAKRIAEGLAKHGIATLRFDFTGIGASEGEFANTTFSSNIADLVLAADHMRKTGRAPAILIGHSLGGAGDPCGGIDDSGSQMRCHCRGSLRSRARHPPVQGSDPGDPRTGRT